MTENIRVEVGPERIVLTDGLQPFMFRTGKGTLFLQAQLSFPPGYQRPPKNAYPGLPGNVVSRDGGRTWQRWRPAGGEDSLWCFEGAATELADGTALVIEWVAEGPDDRKLFHGRLWESRDDLVNLEGPIPFTAHVPEGVPGNDDGGHPYPALTFHRTVLQLPGGDLLAAVYGWREGDDAPIAYQPRMKKNRSMLMRSSDRGRTWRYVSTIAVDPVRTVEGFNEPVMVRVSKGPRAGRLVCLLRAGSDDHPVYATWSDDEGATWTPPKPLDIHGVDPDLVEAADGLLVGVVGRRAWQPRFKTDRCYQIVVSEDGGESWRVVAAWSVEPHAGTDAITSYAGLREIAPGRFLAVYDVGFWGAPIRYVASREVRIVSV